MKRFLIVLMIFLLAGTAFADNSLESFIYPDSVSIVPGESNAFAVGFLNLTDSNGVLSVSSINTPSGFDVSALPDDSFMDAFGEEAFVFYFTVSTSVSSGDYTISVDFSFNSESYTVSLPVQVIRPEVVVSTETVDVSMQRNGSVGVIFDVENKSSSNQCIDFSADSGEYTILTHVSDSSICLNPGEKTTVNLSIITYFTPVDIYDVELIASFSGETISKHLIVKVTGAEVEFVSLPADICAGSNERINIEIKNNTSTVKHVLLMAENELFLPSFANQNIDLAPFESRNVPLDLYVGSSTAAGIYSISLFASTGSSSYSGSVELEVRRCQGSTGNAFSMLLPSGHIYLDKNHSTRIPIQLTSNLDRTQTVHVSVDSDLPTTVPGDVVLNSGQTRTVYFDVNARISDDVGEHSIDVYAWNELYSTTAEQSVNVRSLRRADVDLVSDRHIEIEQGSMGIFVVRINNQGDYDDDFNLSAVNKPGEGESIGFSRSNFEVSKGSTADIYVSVSIPCDMNLGDYDFNILVKRNRTVIFRKNVSFTVVESTYFPGRPDVEISSYPKRVVIDAGTSKKFYFQLKNNTGNEIKGLRLALLYLPSGVSITPNKFDLPAFSVVNISGEIHADEEVEEGEFSGKIELFTDDARSLSDFSVYINSAESGGSDDEDNEVPFLAGLFSFGAGLLSIGTGFLIGLVVILLIAVILMGSVNNNKNEIEWLGREI